MVKGRRRPDNARSWMVGGLTAYAYLSERLSDGVVHYVGGRLLSGSVGKTLRAVRRAHPGAEFKDLGTYRCEDLS